MLDSTGAVPAAVAVTAPQVAATATKRSFMKSPATVRRSIIRHRPQSGKPGDGERTNTGTPPLPICHEFIA
jgi:hypothetical protein